MNWRVNKNFYFMRKPASFTFNSPCPAGVVHVSVVEMSQRT